MWLERAALVREPLTALRDALRNAEVIMNRSYPLTVAQLPFVPGESWVALLIQNEKPLPDGRVSIVACGRVPLTADKPIDAIVVDGWTEIIQCERDNGHLVHFQSDRGVCPPGNVACRRATTLPALGK